MRLLTYALATAVLLAPVAGGAGQQDFSNVEVKASPVSGPVYMLTGAGGNIGVSAGPDGILIVDDQFAPLADKIRAALQGVGGGRLRFVLNTHWHGDHTGGNPVFGKEAAIVAHDNVRRRLAADPGVTGRKAEQVQAEGLPVVTFDSSLSVHFNGEEIKVIHAPHGHTDGDSIIYFTKSNVVHMGDQFFNGRFPFVDLNSGGSVDGYVRNVAEVIAKAPANAKVIPGHGPLATVDDLKAFHQMLVETTGVVRERMKAGRTLDQIKAEGLPAKWAPWGEGFIKTDAWIETVYNSYTKPQAGARVRGHSHRHH
jgi:glyoxylase-like metal-dependent hydrolase (beta-lactamase superfamily II)